VIVAYEWIVNALDETWSTIDKVVRLQRPDAYDAQTACPGWSVRDVLSHLLGFEMMLQGAPVPPYDGPWPEYVHNPIGEINEAFVRVHRAEPGIEVLNQFRAVAGKAIHNLRALDDEAWEKVGWSPEGERPYHRFQETRVLDSWIHLQDIRDALLEPADDHGVAEEIVVNRFEAALPFILGKKMKAQDGTVVHVNLTGRLARTIILATDARSSCRRATRCRPWSSRRPWRSFGAAPPGASPRRPSSTRPPPTFVGITLWRRASRRLFQSCSRPFRGEPVGLNLLCALPQRT
jgi:uncharacterized protein (TIGR03083 family)